MVDVEREVGVEVLSLLKKRRGWMRQVRSDKRLKRGLGKKYHVCQD